MPMTDSDRDNIKLFRYGIISPLLHDGIIDHKDYLAQMEAKTHAVPYHGEKKIASKTIQEWLRNYRRGGIEALRPKKRNDNGQTRKVSADDQDQILELRKPLIHMPVKVFYNYLIKKGEISAEEISYSSVNRLLKKHNLAGKIVTSAAERKRFAHDKVNTLWQGDLSHGPYITIGQKKVKTFLILYIDDCSRFVPYGEFFTNEKFDGLRTVTKKAILRRGVPKILYTDNGKIYRSEMLTNACAELEISLVACKPYSPESKGKCERMFKTIRTQFYPLLRAEPVYSLEELNHRFMNWLEKEYHRNIHASLEGKTPHQIFEDQLERVRFLEDESILDFIFLKKEKRKVHHDSTVKLNHKLYEVPPRFIGQTIDVRYDEKHVYVFEDNKKAAEATLVKYNDNAHVKRSTSPFDLESTGGIQS